jgi:hypothetical protein
MNSPEGFEFLEMQPSRSSQQKKNWIEILARLTPKVFQVL